MKLLLDTHIFAWLIDGDSKLSSVIEHIIRDADNDVYLSTASVWEASIKYHRGKWPMSQPPEILFPTARRQYQIISLPIDEESIAQAALLPPLHRDPFDRIMIGQAIHHGLNLITVDAAICTYPTAPVLVL